MISQPVFPFSLFSSALWDLPNSRPVHSLMLSSHLFLSALSSSPLHCALQDGLARPDEREIHTSHSINICSWLFLKVSELPISSRNRWGEKHFHLLPHQLVDCGRFTEKEPPYLSELLPIYSPSRSVPVTRIFLVPKIWWRTLEERSFQYIWNSLPLCQACLLTLL